MTNDPLRDLEKTLAERARILSNAANNLPDSSFFAKNVSPPPKKMSSGAKALIQIGLMGAGIVGMTLLYNCSQKSRAERYQKLMADYRGTSQSPVYQRENSEITLDFSGRRVSGEGVSSFNMGNCYLEDRYDNSNHLYMFRGRSYSFNFNLSTRPQNAQLTVRHLSSSANGQAGITPVTMYVNRERAARWRQVEAGFTDTTIPIENYLREGENTVSFEYDSNDGNTGYWQKFVRISTR